MIISNAGKGCEWCDKGPFEVSEQAASQRSGDKADLRQLHDAAMALAQDESGAQRTVYHILATVFARNAGKLALR
jgi:hypothetical protein